jgi:hypothetical protein
LFGRRLILVKGVSMRRMVSVLGVAVVVALASSYAKASTVYELTSKKRSTTASYAQTLDGLLMTASGENGNVATTSKGLGVYAGRADKWEVDGAKSTEKLWLEFSASVTLESLKFTGINKKNDWVRIYDSTGATIQDVNLALLAKGGAAVLDLSALDLVGTKFGFGAVGKKDSFLLRKVSVSLAQVGDGSGDEALAESQVVTAVPLPAPVLTGGAMLAAMGITRLYRRVRGL